MGMTIEECIEYMEAEYRYTINEDDMADEEDIEALRTVLETMHKYQKIQEIAEKCNLKLLPKEGMSTFMKDVLEVLEDGRT